MKKISRVKKQKRREVFKKITAIVALICLIGLITFNPFIWWFFHKEVTATIVCIIFLVIGMIDLFFIEFLEEKK